MAENNETVTISLERYEELLDTKKKYENDDRSKLDEENAWLKMKNEEYAYDNAWLSKNCKYEIISNAIFFINRVVDDILFNANSFGYVSKSTIKRIKDEAINNYKDKGIILRGEHSQKDKYDIPIYKNTTEDVPNSDFITLQRDIDNLVYKFMQTHNVANGYIVNYSIDSLQDLKEDGINCPSCDGYLGILDEDKNEIIASM
jgi:hypothetical protein